MTDKEMLERAARAYWGDEIDDVCSIRWLEEDQAIGYTHGDNQDHNGNDREFVWNPRDDDGDCFRLASRLRINIEHMMTMSGIPHGVNCWPIGRGDLGVLELDTSDYNAAIRLAVTKAAAAMAK